MFDFKEIPDEGTDKEGIAGAMGGVRKFVDNIWVELCEIDCGLDNPAWRVPGVLHTSYIISDDPLCGDDFWSKEYVYTLPSDQYESNSPHMSWISGDTYKYYLLVQLARDSADIW